VRGAEWEWQYCGVTALRLLATRNRHPPDGSAWQRLAAALVAALLLHAALLSAWNGPADAPQQGRALGAVSVRWVVEPERVVVPAPQAVLTNAPRAAPVAPVAPVAPDARVSMAASKAQAPRSARSTQPDPSSWVAPPPDLPPTAPHAISPADTPAPALESPEFDAFAAPRLAPAQTSPNPLGHEVPTYRTAWAPARTLHYQLRRGSTHSQAQLQWRPAPEQGRYELALLSHEGVGPPGTAHKPPPMQWTSRGQFDAAGLAPERFTVARRGRDRHAANFQRDKALVTFAGPAAQWPLAAGMQDRMSWMLQLGAIMQAQPELAALGQQLHLWVVGAHGDASVWTFTVGAAEPDPPNPATGLAPTVGMVYLQREAAHPYDTQVQVWLDPAQHHLPVRVVFRRRAGAESTELWLRALQAP
jgi:hypothetical protein